MNRNGQFRDITLRSVVANWASVSSILGAQPDFYSLWASGRPQICIPALLNYQSALCPKVAKSNLYEPVSKKTNNLVSDQV